ncbi:NUDIX hydrolase domain-like protein [Aspergillus spinulosporus]
MPNSLLHIVRECDNFPYLTGDLALYKGTLQNYYAFKVSGCPHTLGHVPNDIMHAFDFSSSGWTVNHQTQELILGASLTPNSTTSSCPGTTETLTSLMESTLHRMSQSPHPQLSRLSRSWRNETFPIRHPGTKEILLEIERSASALFGILTSGVQLTCYVDDPDRGLLLWIARRSLTKQTYPGLLDNTAAGGLETRFLERPIEAVVREAVEEASLDEDLVRKALRGAGAISYYNVKNPSDGCKTGFLQPEVEYVYELQLDSRTVPVPGDGEVEGFYLWTVEEVMRALREGEFKLNSAVAVIDFLVRHGVVTAENEAGYLEIVIRLHRRLEVGM